MFWYGRISVLTTGREYETTAALRPAAFAAPDREGFWLQA